jgi:TolB protein
MGPLFETPSRLLTGPGDARYPRFSPDGKTLAFSRRVWGREHIWLRSTDGAQRQVTFGSGNDTDPAWSTDGETLYFASDRGRGIFMPAIYRLKIPPPRPAQ